MAYRIRFDEDVREKRAHADAKKGGFRTIVIPRGTERVINRASLDHHRARGVKLSVLEEVPDSARSWSQEPVPQSSAPQPAPLTKLRVRDLVDAVLAAISANDVKATAEALRALLVSDLGEVVPEIPDDTLALLRAALEDLDKGRLDVHPTEFGEALGEIKNLTLPPSKRK